MASLQSRFLSWRLHKTSLSSGNLYPFNRSFPHTLVTNAFHGRNLFNNAITSIPSGAFTGLTALFFLWGRGAVIPLPRSIVSSSVLYSPYCMRKCVLQICLFSWCYIFLWHALNWFHDIVALFSFSFLEQHKVFISSPQFIQFKQLFGFPMILSRINLIIISL